MNGTENLARHAALALEKHGEYEWLFFEDRWHTNVEIGDRAARVATGLTELGLRPGDRLVVLMANCPEVFVAYIAAWRAGAVVTPLIFLLTESELRHALADSGAAGVVTTAEYLPKVLAAVRDLPDPPFVVTTGSDITGVAQLPDLESCSPGSIVSRDASDLAALLYTGGTTGRSKGVPLTHANLTWCGRAVRTAASGHLSLQLLPVPLSHVFGLGVLCAGIFRDIPARYVLMRWFDPAAWLDLAERHRVEVGSLVPSMIQMLLAQPLESRDLSSLVAVTCGGAPLPAATRDAFESRVPGAVVYEGYGCTESAAMISANPYGARRPGSVGRPVPGCEVSIRSDSGTPLPAGEDGEIWARSGGVMAGYWGSSSSAVSPDGWLRTGDIGHLDADGYLYIVDRKKDLIIRGGFNVYPVDVENVLLRHPAVAQAGVVGRPDERLGEEIVAFVSLLPGCSAAPAELVAHARQHLAANKYPREVRIVPALPLTSIGKLNRKELRTWTTT